MGPVGRSEMIYEIKGRKESRASVQRIMAVLKDVLPRYHGYIGRVTDSSIEFSSPLIQSNWNIFAPVSRGMITIREEEGHSVLSYRLSLFRVRVIATLFTALGIGMAVWSGEVAGLAYIVPMAVVVGCGGLYGINYLITMGRVSSFFDRVLKELPAEPPPVPARTQNLSSHLLEHIPAKPTTTSLEILCTSRYQTSFF